MSADFSYLSLQSAAGVTGKTLGASRSAGSVISAVGAKPSVAVDLDGVVYEWDRTARYLLRNYRGVEGLHSESTSWNWIQQNVEPEDWRWLWNEGVKRGLFRYGHMTKGARIGLEALLDIGYKLLVVSHRPAHAINDTLDWISMFFKDIPLEGVHLLTQGENKAQVNADILIDDKPENIRDWLDAERVAVLFEHPWNVNWTKACHLSCYEAETTHLHRASNWADVVSVLADLQQKEAR